MFHVQDSVISTINVKVDKLADSVATFKASLEYTHTHKKKDEGGFIVLKIATPGRWERYGWNQNCHGSSGKYQKMEYLENQSGRNYSTVSGIQESAGGMCEVVESKVRDQAYG